tara:strand:+ start:764 stop:1129 length:366 start_codon:yes stop_codon:yes gene_type:complete
MNKDKETDRIVNIEYPALSKARDTLNIQWYRSAMEPQRFRELSRRSDLKGWIQAGGHFGLFMITGLLVYLAWAAEFWIIFFYSIVYTWNGWFILYWNSPPRVGAWNCISHEMAEQIFSLLV